MTIFGIIIGKPLYLLLLLLVPWFWRSGSRSLAGLGPVRGVLVAGLRSIIVIAIVLSLAELRTRQTSRSVSVVYLLDQSLSVSVAQREGMFRYVRNEVEAHRQAGRGDRAGVIVFGRTAMIEVPPLEDDLAWLTHSELVVDGLAEATNLADALKLAMTILPDQGARRIVVVTDGNENLGNARQFAPKLGKRGVGLDIVAVGRDEAVNVAVEKVVVPSVSRQGAPVEVRVVIRNDNLVSTDAANGSVAGQLRVTRRIGSVTELVTEQEAVVTPGKNVFALVDAADSPAGFYTYEADFSAAGIVEQTIADNRATGFTSRAGRPRVLLLENIDSPGEFTALSERLRDRQLNVEVRSSAAGFSSLADLHSYDCVLLANVARVTGQGGEALFSDDQIEALVRNTEMGCGLILLGGPQSFGAGGWANTRLEEASPVNFTIKNAKVIPSGALALVIDKSGSMQGEKMAMCQKAAMEAVRVLGPKDHVGVVAFDGDARWTVPMQLIGDRQNAITRNIRRLSADGGTNMYPGMLTAFTGLRSVDAAVKHMIVLTDGQTPPADFDALVDEMRKQGVTVSTIAIGAGATRPLLNGIARRGNGKFYSVTSPQAIPRIFIKEAMRVTKPLIYEREEGFTPQVVFQHEALTGIGDPLPPINGFVLTELKDNPLVSVALRSPVPFDDSTSTIMASWNYGLGRVLVLTTDAGQRWASAWQKWDDYDALFENMIRWTLRPQEGLENFVVNTEFRDGEVRVIVTAVDEAGEMIDFLPISCLVSTPQAGLIDLSMQQTAPGRYNGSIAIDQPGSYLLAINTGIDGSVIRTGVTVPSAVEFRDLEPNREMLEILAAQKPAGGQPGSLIDYEQLLAEPSNIRQLNTFRPTLASAFTMQDAWPILVMVAAIFFFFDIFVRRVVVDPAQLLAPLAQRLRSPQVSSSQDDRFERLRNQKLATEQKLSRRASHNTRYEPSSIPNAPNTERTTTADASRNDVSAPANVVSSQEAEVSYTDRLLKAKRAAQARHTPPQ